MFLQYQWVALDVYETGQKVTIYSVSIFYWSPNDGRNTKIKLISDSDLKLINCPALKANTRFLGPRFYGLKQQQLSSDVLQICRWVSGCGSLKKMDKRSDVLRRLTLTTPRRSVVSWPHIHPSIWSVSHWHSALGYFHDFLFIPLLNIMITQIAVMITVLNLCFLQSHTHNNIQLTIIVLT